MQSYIIRCPGSMKGMYLIHMLEESIPIRGRKAYGIINGSLWIIKGTMVARRASAGMNLSACQSSSDAGRL
jgi:hypothetical protein